MKEKVQKIIEKIRPHLNADGGDIDVVDGVVTVKLKGACHGCPCAAMTLQNGVERAIKQELP